MASSHFPLRGGLNLSASPLEVWPGALRDSRNYFESTKGGYERIAGYERFDGKARPSDSTYYKLSFDSWDTHVTDITAASTITVASSLTFYILAIDTSVSDTLIAYGTALVGTIADPYVALDWDGVSSLTSIVERGASTDALDETYIEATWNHYRNLIGQVGGTSTAPAGVLQINDSVVVFKNDSSSNPEVYYASSTGWTAGRIGRVVEITSYTADSILPNETINSATHRVAAVCKWYDPITLIPDPAKAWLVVIPTTALNDPPTGSNTASGGATFTIASVIQPIDAFGTYIESVNHNFLSHPDS